MDRARLFREAAAKANEGRDRTGWRYSASLRRLALDHCRSSRRAHQSFSEIARALGVSTVTLGRWLDAEPVEPSTTQFREVVLAPSAPAPAASQLVVVLPSGLRVEGLDLRQVLELNRSLR